MPPYLQWLRYSWLPGLLLVLVSAQYLSWIDFRSLLTAQLAPGLLCAALLLAVFFKSSRVAFSAALLLFTFVAFSYFDWLQSRELVSLCLALSSVNIALIAFARDRSVLSGFGITLLLAILGQGVGVYLLQKCCESVVFDAGLIVSVTVPWLRSEIVLGLSELLFGAGLFLAALKTLIKPEQTGFGLLICILLLVVGNYLDLGVGTVASAVSLVLVLQVLRNAYELAFRDELTGIPSRRAYSRYLLTLGRHFSIAVVDIDHFKKLNDRHGHPVGDQALRMVASKIARFGGGRAFRYGGEEFVVVIPGRDRHKAQASLEQMREQIAAYTMRLRSSSRGAANAKHARRRRGQGGGKSIKTTVSVGVASSGGGLKSPEEVLKAADSALYKAKRSGRNRVCVHN